MCFLLLKRCLSLKARAKTASVNAVYFSRLLQIFLTVWHNLSTSVDPGQTVPVGAV